jgi:cell division transport system permease protein
MAVLLVVGNTIRLEIQNRRSEIEIIKLIGGTNAFIRRPFLYTGFWYGLLGGGVAMVLIIGAAILLKEPINHLVMLYDSSIKLHGFDLTTLLVLSLGSPLLGLVGSFFSVGRHLSEIEPK